MLDRTDTALVNTILDAFRRRGEKRIQNRTLQTMLYIVAEVYAAEKEKEGKNEGRWLLSENFETWPNYGPIYIDAYREFSNLGNETINQYAVYSGDQKAHVYGNDTDIYKTVNRVVGYLGSENDLSLSKLLSLPSSYINEGIIHNTRVADLFKLKEHTAQTQEG